MHTALMRTRAITLFLPYKPPARPDFKLHLLTRQILPFLGLVAILLASGMLYLPVFHWLILKMSLTNGYLHLFALLGLSALGVQRLMQMKTLPFHFPVLFHSGALIWIPASLLYLWNEANVGFHTLSAALFIIFLFGLAGHFLTTPIWRSLLLPLLLLILVLPFEHYLDVYLGFPLRLLSAEMTSALLKVMQLPLLTVESILMVDNKAAIVDLDCSGINSLWVGLIFYLLLTWVERFAITRRWVLIGLGFMGLLVISNVFRIVILVTLDLVLDQPELARLFHQSLGLLGFTMSSLVIWWVLQHFASRQTSHASENSRTATPYLSYTPWLITALIFTLANLYQPYQTVAATPASHAITVPAAYTPQATSLSKQERDFFVSNQPQAQKFSLKIPHKDTPIKASLVLVWSHAWKTHHVPENCYLSQGYSISDKGLWQIKPNFNVRYLALNKPLISQTIAQTKAQTIPHTPQESSLQKLTGIYWFQSAERTTPDYSSRVIDNLFHPGKEWVMVSVLWDSPVTPADITPLVTALQQSLEKPLNENQ